MPLAQLSVLLIHRWVGSRDGGAETHIDLIIEGLRTAGHRVEVITRAGARIDRFPPGVRVHTVTSNLGEDDNSYTDWRVYPHTMLFMVKVWLKLVHLRVRGRKFDVVSTHFATEAIVSWFWQRLTGASSVHVLEGYTSLEARWAKRSTKAIAISEHDARECEREHGFLPPVIDIGLPDRVLASFESIRKARRTLTVPVVLMVARLDHRKGVDVLLRAMREIVDAGVAIRAVVVGEGIERARLQATIENLELGEHVELIGSVDQDRLCRLWTEASFFALPTRYEGFGIVLIEAMAAGLPIVTTTVGAVPDVVGEAAVLVPPDSPHACAEAILMLSRNPVMARSLADAAVARVSTRYRWAELGPQYAAVYEQAAGMRR